MKNFSGITDDLDITTKKYVDDGLAEKANSSDLATKANISGQAFTGGISAPNISTGTDAANYFQSQKFRGEGNADTYYHAIDFGYAGHSQVDFHEYGGVYNFYQNTNGASDTGHLVGAFTPDGIKEGETLLKDKYLGKSGGSITGDLTVGGNLTINGTTTTVDSTTLQVKDKLIEVAKDNTVKLTNPAGIVVPKYDGTSYGALVINGDGNAQVGDVKLDASGNIDVANSDLQTLATRTGLVGGNLVQYDSSAQTLKDAGKKIGDLALKTDIPTNHVTTNTTQTISGNKTFTGEVKFGSTENFQGYYIKRMIGGLGIGTAYNKLDSSYKDGTWHRMWRLRFPSGSNFWGKIKITLYGNYSSFNASGVMSKSITCNFNASSIYNNVGCYDGLGVNVEQDFRISEAIWNATVSAWEVLIWQKNLSGNNSPVIMLECWTTNNTNYINAFNGIAAQAVELTQSTSYSAQKASPTGGTKTVEWATLPVYENPLGEEIATMSDLSNVVTKTGDQYIQGEKTFSNPILTQVQIGDSNRIYGASDSPVVDQFLPAKDGTFAMTSDIPDVSGKANLDGGNTFTGKQTLNSPASDGYSINAAGYVKGSWLQSGVKSNYGSGTGMVCVFDGNGWIYYRTPAEIVAEAGGGGSTEVVQTTGTSTTSVMSQKATTDELAKKANLEGANEFIDGTNTFRDIDGTTQISGSQVILKAIGVMGSASLSVQTDNNNEVFGVESDSENGVIHLNKTISLNGDMGTAGQVLTSQGASAAPQWKSMPTYSLSGTTLTITLP